jgi:hypothetical protein
MSDDADEAKMPQLIVKDDLVTTTKYQAVKLSQVQPTTENSSCVPSRCLFLDGKLVSCLADAAQYHELFAHFPAQYLPNARPTRVLVVSDTDGLLAREFLKYASLTELVLVYYDDELLTAVGENLSEGSTFDDAPKVTKIVGQLPDVLLSKLQDQKPFDVVAVDVKNEAFAKILYGSAAATKRLAELVHPEHGLLVRDAVFGDFAELPLRVSYGFGSKGMCRRVKFALHAPKPATLAPAESFEEQKIQTLYYRRSDHAKHVALKERMVVQGEARPNLATR